MARSIKQLFILAVILNAPVFFHLPKKMLSCCRKHYRNRNRVENTEKGKITIRFIYLFILPMNAPFWVPRCISARNVLVTQICLLFQNGPFVALFNVTNTQHRKRMFAESHRKNNSCLFFIPNIHCVSRIHIYILHILSLAGALQWKCGLLHFYERCSGGDNFSSSPVSLFQMCSTPGLIESGSACYAGELMV